MDKTAMDAAHLVAASNHPEWLRPSAIPLTLIAGPPCAGKTTYIREHRQTGDVVIDLDGIMTRLRPSYQHWSGPIDSRLLNRAIRVRNEMLGQLSQRQSGRAWFIASAPTTDERAWWASKLNARIVLLHPGVVECKRRAVDRGTPKAVAGVDRWEHSSRLPWSPAAQRKPKALTGADGWPVS